MKWRLVLEFPTISELIIPLVFVCIFSLTSLITTIWATSAIPESIKSTSKWVALSVVTAFSSVGTFGLGIWVLDWVLRYG